jgi:hypothetical protein
MTAKERKLYRVKQPFALYGKGTREVYTVGSEVFSADHPAVKANPACFELIVVRGEVETATAAPGESRAVTIPKSK